MKSAAARGLGYAHRQQRERLLRKHVDGNPCYWCGRPLYRDPAQNWDGNALHADHTIARSQGGTVADRLVHDLCNKQRQDGRNDHLRPAVTGINVADARAVDDQLGLRLMPWP
ncbi:HNH endonuclease [Rhodococcus marinonascens]|uniref:HNH endonuclease n=1 Tax=Rhodococcus marinonascens TaxID=38311 RepID=UPI000932FBCD|nr:hypothetical protein [Rhodococcus marinonascens]